MIIVSLIISRTMYGSRVRGKGSQKRDSTSSFHALKVATIRRRGGIR